VNKKSSQGRRKGKLEEWRKRMTNDKTTVTHISTFTFFKTAEGTHTCPDYRLYYAT
jgi:hypothetical protein